MTERFALELTPIEGLTLVERRRRGDERGFLSRFFCAQELTECGFTRSIVQINQTLTHRCGAIRGMHFQLPPHAEDKFVSVLRGAVFDVAVDLRAGSPTMLDWHGEVLSAENSRSLFIPAGFAHGFQTLTNDCELIYLHTAAYAAEAESGLNPFDPVLSIDWPMDVTDISTRDREHPGLASDFGGLVL